MCSKSFIYFDKLFPKIFYKQKYDPASFVSKLVYFNGFDLSQVKKEKSY